MTIDTHITSCKQEATPAQAKQKGSGVVKHFWNTHSHSTKKGKKLNFNFILQIKNIFKAFKKTCFF